MAAPRKAKGLKVTAPLVQVRIGNRAEQFFIGDLLPEGVDENSLKHLKDLGYVDEIDAPAEPDNK